MRKTLKVLSVILSLVVGVLGLFFIIAATYDKSRMGGRLIIGGMLLILAVVLFILSRMTTEQITYRQEMKVDLSGDIDIETLKCRNCGGNLGKDSITVIAGAVMVNCNYCGTSYQLKEAPKW